MNKIKKNVSFIEKNEKNVSYSRSQEVIFIILMN